MKVGRELSGAVLPPRCAPGWPPAVSRPSRAAAPQGYLTVLFPDVARGGEGWDGSSGLVVDATEEGV